MAEEYLPLSFNHEGYASDTHEQQAILSAVVNTTRPITDVWLLSYGWNNDRQSGKARYQRWSEILRAIHQQKFGHQEFNPLFIGVHWPSKAWVGEVAQNVARLHRTEAVTGGAPGAFEFRHPRAEEQPPTTVPTFVPPPSASQSAATDAKAQFIAEYQPIMDAENVYGDTFQQDFGRLYDFMYQEQPPTVVEIEAFVKILKRYNIIDPHNDLVEQQNVITAPVERLTSHIRAIQTTRPQEFGTGAIFDKLLNVFRTFTFWQMKGRAAIVGQTGVYPFLGLLQQTLKQHNLQVRLNLLGHSFGAKLVTAAVAPAANATELARPFVDTLVLLLGAFSQFSFSNNIPLDPGGAGRYSAIIKQGLVRNPVVTIYSKHDTANRIFYPAGMRLAAPFSDAIYERRNPSDDIERFQVSQNMFGSIGSNGAQGLSEAHVRNIEIPRLEDGYRWGNLSGVRCLNIDGASVIQDGIFPSGAHTDIDDDELYYPVLAMSFR